MRHSPGPAAPPSNPSPRERETLFDRPIALAALGVLLTGYAFKISNFGSLALLVLLGTIIANLVVIASRWLAAGNRPAARQSVVVSLTLEGFLLSFTALVAVDHQPGLLTALTSLLLLASLVLFLRASHQAADENGEVAPGALLPDPARRPNDAIPMAVRNRPAVQPYRPLEIESSRPTPPALLFENDPLYVFPDPPQHARFFVVAKNNESLVKCEDACAFSESRQVYALSDGASSSNFPRPWATLLARSWVENPSEFVQYMKEQQLDLWLDVRRKHWQNWISRIWLPSINERNRAQRQPLTPPEVVDEIVTGGASATLLGLWLSPKRKAWECIAVGDTCLFHVPANYQETGAYRAFPLQRSADFTSSPSALSTIAGQRPRAQRLKGEISPGDIFFLATDALAAWILQRLEQGDVTVWQRLLRIQSNEQFDAFVNRMRNASRSQDHMHDDDTSLFIIETASMQRG